jgi:hypothetical protein
MPSPSSTLSQNPIENYPLPIIHEEQGGERQSNGIAPVGMRGPAVSDNERELHIRNCGYLMEDAMRRWCETGCFSYRGEADRCRLLMQEAIRARSPEYVARLERERGLA